MDEPLVDTREVVTEDGWRLHLRRTGPAAGPARGTRPVLIVPGYGMNGFIFGFHPRGTSMERHFAGRGLEVWTVDLRGSGGSRTAHSGAPAPSIAGYAAADVTATVAAVLAATETGADRVDLLGASLGGSIAYAHLALVPAHRIGAVVAVGSPLRWVDVHPALRFLARPQLLRRLKFSGTRQVARLALPALVRAPKILSIYMNHLHVDLTAATELVKTVADPQPEVNYDVARWIRDQDLILDGVNVTTALGGVTCPLLLVLGNRDGIVPESAALSARAAWGGQDVRVLNIGTDHDWYAHADLFVGDAAPQLVFDPVADWLLDRAAG